MPNLFTISSRPVWAVLCPLMVALLILLSRRRPNVREGWVLLGGVGLCALVFGDLASNGSTDTVLVAQSGTVEVEQISLEVGGAFKGSADSLSYAQVNSSGPIPGGCEIQVTNIQFDVTLDAPL